MEVVCNAFCFYVVTTSPTITRQPYIINQTDYADIYMPLYGDLSLGCALFIHLQAVCMESFIAFKHKHVTQTLIYCKIRDLKIIRYLCHELRIVKQYNFSIHHTSADTTPPPLVHPFIFCCSALWPTLVEKTSHWPIITNHWGFSAASEMLSHTSRRNNQRICCRGHKNAC